jgi:crotonobetainyl-CoA:carnitine CoA-transferase CaiB-like acyl-CoA transferase
MFNRDFIVLELASILAGPMTTMFFAELGARVIKLENPHTGGDPTRAWKLGSERPDDDISGYFSCANWGKESLACDLTTPAGLEIAHALAARADIVVASFKPGDEERLKLDYATLRELNPKLIYGQISAYGAADPRPGFDAILQAEAGFAYLNGEADGPPTKMPVALIDLLLAHQLKEGLLLALLKRDRQGEGSYLSTSLFQAGVSSLANQATNYLVAGNVPKRMGSEHPNIVPYGSVLTCADGRELVIAAATERQYRELVGAIGLAPLAKDERFSSGQRRVENRELLLQLIRAQTAAMDSEMLAAKLTNARVPFGFVNDMAAVFEHESARALLLDGRVDGHQIQGVRSFTVGGDAVDLKTPTPPPHFDEHRLDIVCGLLGYADSDVARLDNDGAFGDLKTS